MAQVDIQGLTKSYGTVEVLHGLNLRIENGTFVALVGPSGCGKSTLLRMVAGLEDVTGGEIRIADRVVNQVPPKDRDVAMVFQNYALYPHLSVEGNMAFGLRLAGTPKDEIARRVGEASRMLGLDALLTRKPGQLSGGQRQRVAMGRAIVRQPKVFLFDEPLSNLDAKLRVSVRGEIKELHQRLRTTTIYVTHDQIEAMTMADVIVIMNGGRIEQIGTPAELYHHPVNTFVAGFIGSPPMNLIEGAVADGRFDYAGGGGFDLPAAVRHAVPDGATILGLRPEDLAVVDTAVSGQPALAARIRLVEPTGPEDLLVASHSAGEVIAAVRGSHGIAAGADVVFAFAPDKMHFFSRDTGRRLKG